MIVLDRQCAAMRGGNGRDEIEAETVPQRGTTSFSRAKRRVINPALSEVAVTASANLHHATGHDPNVRF